MYLNFFNDSSHEVVIIFNFVDHNSSEHVASKSNIFEGVECESLIKEPLLKSHFLNIDKKEIENMNKGGWKTHNHVELERRMHLMNGKCFVILTCKNQLQILKMKNLLHIWWTCYLHLYFKLQKKMVAYTFQ